MFSDVFVGKDPEHRLHIAALPRNSTTVLRHNDKDWCVLLTPGAKIAVMAKMRDAVDALEAGDDLIVDGYQVNLVRHDI